MGVNYGPRVITDGLVLALDAADRSSYPGSGTTWTDLSGNSNTGTLTNGPTYNSSNGGSIVFDGTNDFVDFTSDFNLVPTAGLTISTWFKTSVANLWLVSKISTIFVNGYFLAGKTNGGMDFAITNISVSTTAAINTGGWLNIAATWTPSTSMGIYRNGTLENTNTTSIPASIVNPSTPLEIGRRNDNAADYWNGTIAQVSIYNRALTASEIEQNFNAIRWRFNI